MMDSTMIKNHSIKVKTPTGKQKLQFEVKLDVPHSTFGTTTFGELPIGSFFRPTNFVKREDAGFMHKVSKRKAVLVLVEKKTRGTYTVPAKKEVAPVSVTITVAPGTHFAANDVPVKAQRKAEKKAEKKATKANPEKRAITKAVKAEKKAAMNAGARVVDETVPAVDTSAALQTRLEELHARHLKSLPDLGPWPVFNFSKLKEKEKDRINAELKDLARAVEREHATLAGITKIVWREKAKGKPRTSSLAEWL